MQLGRTITVHGTGRLIMDLILYILCTNSTLFIAASPRARLTKIQRVVM